MVCCIALISPVQCLHRKSRLQLTIKRALGLASVLLPVVMN